MPRALRRFEIRWKPMLSTDGIESVVANPATALDVLGSSGTDPYRIAGVLFGITEHAERAATSGRLPLVWRAFILEKANRGIRKPVRRNAQRVIEAGPIVLPRNSRREFDNLNGVEQRG